MTAAEGVVTEPITADGGALWLTHPVTEVRVNARQVPVDVSGDLAAAVRAVIPTDGSVPSLLALTVPPGTLQDDEDADGIMAALGYAWVVNADPKRTGPFESRQSLWAPDLTAVVVDVDLTGRRNVNRSTGDAFVALVADAVRYMLDGSPVKADGDRLFEAPLPDLSVADLRLWVDAPSRP